MYKNIPFYEPFQHENLEVKNNIIISARGQDRKKIEGAFTAILIYANLVDYLVSTLLDNLQRMITIDSFNRFGGIFYFDGSVKKTNRPLGFLIRELEPLEFPGKKDFMDCLVRFNKLRNPIMHELMKRDPNDAAKNLDREVDNFVNTAEDILARFNTITAGILVAWRKNYPAPATSSSQQTPNAKG